MSTRRPRPSEFARRFFALGVVVLGAAGGVAHLLIHAVQPRLGPWGWQLAHTFWCSTALLACGSWSLHAALQWVRREKQRQFRQALSRGLLAGVLFVGMQSWALWTLLGRGGPRDAATEAPAFVAVFAVLHALHFSVALLFLSFVSVRAWSDCYDHEYFGGVYFCAWFWHLLGAVWLVIFAVFQLAGG